MMETKDIILGRKVYIMRKVAGFIALLLLSTCIAGCGNSGLTKTESDVVSQENSSNTDSKIDEPVVEKHTFVEKDELGYNKVQLSGIADEIYTADDFCYIESDKYFLLLEKDIAIPSNIKVVLDEIVDEIELKVGLSFVTDDFVYEEFDNCTINYGYNPWKKMNYGKKVPIFLKVDRQDEGCISGATPQYVDIYLYELYSDEFWNSVTSYADNPWRRENHVNYQTFAHELTHTVVWRYCETSRIINEGYAEFIEMTVMGRLSEKYNDDEHFGYSTYDAEFEPDLTEENAEEYFINDFNDLDVMHRGSEYTYGKFLAMFLDEKLEGAWMLPYFASIKADGLKGPNTEEYTREMGERYCTLFKNVFGEDIFKEFGEWYQINKENLYHNWE